MFVIVSVMKNTKVTFSFKTMQKSNPSTFSSLRLHRPNAHCTAYANTIGTMSVAGFCKPAGIGLYTETHDREMSYPHIRHDRGSKLKPLPVPAGIPAGFGGYTHTHTRTHL